MLHKQQTITVLTAAALIAAPAGPAALAAQVSGSMTLTVGSPYLTNNGTSAAIDAQGTTPVVESPGYTLLPLRGVVEAMGARWPGMRPPRPSPSRWGARPGR